MNIKHCSIFHGRIAWSLSADFLLTVSLRFFKLCFYDVYSWEHLMVLNRNWIYPFSLKCNSILRQPLILGDAGSFNSLFNAGYQGCIRGFSIQQEVVDLYTKLVNQPPGVVAGCGSLEEACSIQPCYHGSVCNQEMNSFTCDCTGTGYEGSVCSKEAKSLTFSGEQFLRQLTSYPESHVSILENKKISRKQEN